MSEAKKYFYLKLKDNFYDRPEIKTIEGFQNGYEYICIMQKMYLRSLCRGGKLMLTDKVPYDIEMLSSVLGHKQETIKTAIEVFDRLGLCAILSDKCIYMTEIQNFIGQSSSEGDRVKEYRHKIKHHERAVQIKYKRTQNGDKRTPELELEQEIKIEQEKELVPAIAETPGMHKRLVEYFDKAHQEVHNGEKIAWIPKEIASIKNIIATAKKTGEDVEKIIAKKIQLFQKKFEQPDNFYAEKAYTPSFFLSQWNQLQEPRTPMTRQEINNQRKEMSIAEMIRESSERRKQKKLRGNDENN